MPQTFSVPLTSCWISPISPINTFTAVAALVVTAHAAPDLARRLTLRRALHQLLRTLPGA
ncbi:hypothetical protein ACFYW9_29600 [Streptomyces sp. NPDC002698]|uniref:hypothetical protein n=1 Tax=Streptomyces sp. NPDC002698 TaxID=3364660 RepID=UPI0036CB4661